MTRYRSLVRRLQQQDTLNFWLTNRIPRKLLTRWMGRLSRVESPRLTALLLRVWRMFADDLRLEEAESSEFSSLHACFTRKLKPGARPVDSRPEVIVSPCDAEVGACGSIGDGTLLQAKGMVYRMVDLLCDRSLAAAHQGGSFATLRLKSSMYHRFHAPCHGSLDYVDYVAGEVHNVNPPTLKRIPGLFCRNERAILPLATGFGPVTLIPVAAVLVASMRLARLPYPLDLQYRGPNRIQCRSQFKKGDELGYFEHGSTIILLTGPGLEFDPKIRGGKTVLTGQPLLHRANRSQDTQPGGP